MTRTLEQSVEILRTNFMKLDARDVNFAESLLSAYKRDRVSHKQAEWIEILARRVTADVAPAHLELALPRLSAFLRAIRERAPKVKYPKIRLRLPGDNGRISVRLARSGVIYIDDVDRTFYDEKNGRDRAKQYGIIRENSDKMTASRYADKTLLPAVMEKLREFESDPKKAASVEGHATGECCFCGRHLDTAASVHAGYGPVCAGYYGLPYGEGSASNNLFDALDNARLIGDEPLFLFATPEELSEAGFIGDEPIGIYGTDLAKSLNKGTK